MEENFEENLQKNLERVEFVLKRYKEARDNDWLLYLLTLWHFNKDTLLLLLKLLYYLYKLRKEGKEGELLNPDVVKKMLKVCEKIPSFETYARCRRKIQNELGIYLPSKDARFRRKKYENFMRRAMKSEP